MPIDRELTLKRAEKLLRQGRLELAIAEYGQVVGEFPRDWATANLLGDLYVRAGQVGAASQQYARIAEHLAGEGFTAKAAALYKKVIKLNPSDEPALLRSAELAAAQGLTADVRTFMTALFQMKLKRGDREGAVRLAHTRISFDPSDVVGRLDAARMLAEAGDNAGAAGELRAAGLALESQGRLPEAVRALRETLRFTPGDHDTRAALVRLLVQQGEMAAAAELAETREQLRELVNECRARGFHDAAHDALVRLGTIDGAASLDRVELARACLDRGDIDEAVTWAAVDGVTELPALAVILGEAYLRQGRLDEGQTLLTEAVSRDPGQCDDVARLVDTLTASDPDAAAAALLVVVDAEMERGDASSANRRLSAFLAAAPDTLVVLRRHIDVCVDRGVQQDTQLAQLRLADALIRRREWQEARFIVEDLVAASPGDRQFLDRLAQVLDGLGLAGAIVPEPAPHFPDGSTELSELLLDGAAPASGLSDDFSDLVAALAQDRYEAPVCAQPGSSAADPEPALALPETMADVQEIPSRFRRFPAAPSGDLVIVNDDLRRLFEDGDVPPAAIGEDAAFEVDLSGALDLIEPPEQQIAPQAATAADVGTDTLDGFFKGLREQGDDRLSEAERLCAEGARELAAGRFELAIAAYRAAAREPGVRLRASRAIAKIARDRGNLPEAIEWLERAAEVPAETPEQAHALLYELADTLVAADEDARALAVFMELRATSTSFQDVEQRIIDLSGRRAGWSRGRSGGVA